ncbi:glycosyltransferase [Pseudanabaena biceps]|nr:glycosyltransferase [Pseudanabaena biceps]
MQETYKKQVWQHFEEFANYLDRWRDRNLYYYQDIEKLHQFLIPQNSNVLEIGCGTGELLAATKPNVGVGIDFSESVIAIAQQKYPDLKFYVLDAEQLTHEQLSFPNFDYIILSGTMGYLSNIQAVLENLQAFCHPQTRIIISFHNYLWEPLLWLAEKVRQRRPQPLQNWLAMPDIINFLEITGYIPIKQSRRFLFPKNIPIIAKLINQFICHLPLIDHLCLTHYVVARKRFEESSNQSVTSSLPSVSIVVPTRNESGNIKSIFSRIPALGSHTEIIFVEGNSTDDTWDSIQLELERQPTHPQFSYRAFKQTGKGKGDAVRLGFSHAKGDILMILDADLTVAPEVLPQFLTAIASGKGEFINGSRLVYPRSDVAMPWLNTLANKFFASLFSFLLNQRLKDTLCGTKVLWRRDYERIVAQRHYFGDFDPFGDFDLLFGAAKLNLHIVEVPIRYQPRTYGSSNISHFREGIILLKMCVYAARKIRFL